MINSIMCVYIVLDGDSAENIGQEDPSIGLFKVLNTVTNSQMYALVYAEDDLSRYGAGAIKHATGFLASNGIGEISEAGNFKSGGGNVQTRQTNITINNTNGLTDSLNRLGIRLIGQRVYIVEYSDGVANPLYSGIVDALTWNETTIQLATLPNTGLTRRSNVMIDGLPVTLGNCRLAEHLRTGEPVYLNYSDFVASNDADEDFIISKIQGDIAGSSLAHKILIELGDSITITENDIYDRLLERYGFKRDRSVKANDIAVFAVIKESNWGVPLRTYDPFTLDLVDWTEDTGDPGMPYRDHRSVFLVIHLERELSFGDVPPYTVRLVIPNLQFMADGWPNASVDTPTPKQSSPNIDLYGGDGDMYEVANSLVLPIRPYGRAIDYDKTRRDISHSIYPAKIEIMPFELSDSTLATIASYLPVTLPQDVRGNTDIDLLGERGATGQRLFLIVDDRILLFPNTAINSWTDEWTSGGRRLEYLNNGLYWDTVPDDSQVTVYPPAWAYPPRYGPGPDRNELRRGGGSDVDLSTYAWLSFRSVNSSGGGSTGNYVCAIIVGLPAIPNGYSHYKDAFLHTSMVLRYTTVDSHGGPKLDDMAIMAITRGDTNSRTMQSWPDRIFLGQGGTVHMDNHIATALDGSGRNIYDLEDQRAEFIANVLKDGDRLIRLTGYENFKIDGIDFLSDRRRQMAIIFNAPNVDPAPPYDMTFDLRIHEIGVLFKADINISERIKYRSSGRTFGGINSAYSDMVWENRKVAHNHISNPIDAVEHLLRLSNWAENDPGLLYAPNPGKQYAAERATLIDTESFDSATLNQIRQLSMAGQVLDEGKAYNDAIADDICKDFYIARKHKLLTGVAVGGNTLNWIGNFAPPFESVGSLDTPPPEGEIPVVTLKESQLVTIKEPSSRDIWCQPIVKYFHVNGIGYTKSMAVTGIVTNTAWNADLTPGFEPLDGERVWNKCKTLFLKYGNFVEMPESAQGQDWIRDYSTALWKINKIIDWQQNSRTQISVPWSIGRTWRVGTHVYISYKHVRDGDKLLCVCESVRKSKYTNKVTCDLIILDDVASAFGSYSTIEEIGSANIEIDENAMRDTEIAEGQT
ncbi:MAG: hypothetical protein LBC59_09580 [Chitinispirillales bacterium]|jgi:hypothetical protein|nr:hypothetical protein [Chitinispirillales bacterium]